MGDLADLLINLRADPSGIQEGMSKGKKLAAAGGAAMAAAIGAAAFEAMDISAANDKLAAQLGLSEDESARVGKVAGTLFAGAYGENIGEVNTAVGAVMTSIHGMATASSDDLQAVTTKALDFAGAFDVDVQRAVDVAGRVMNSGLAKDATEAFDLITAASQKVPANLREDVLDAADEYSQFFATLGIKGPDAFGMLVDASKKGMFGIDKVGDAIKEFTIRATDGSASTQTAFKTMGLNAGKMQDSILAGGDSAATATQRIVDGLLSIKDPGDQATAALSLFGTPLEDLNVKDIPEFLKTLQGGSDAMAGFAGASTRMGTTLNDNASTNIESFKRQAQLAFVNVVGGKVIPILDNAARWLSGTLGPAITGIVTVLDASLIPMMKTAAEFIGDNEKPITIVAGVITAALLPALTVLAAQAVATAATTVAAWATQSAAAVRSSLAGVGALTRVALGWLRTGVQAMASAARIAAAWLLSMGPIPLIIAAVAGLVVVIVKNWDRIKSAISAAAQFVWGVIQTAFGAIKTIVTTYVNAWRAVITTAWNAIKAIVRGAVDAVIGAVRGWGKLVGIVTGFFGKIASGVAGKVGDVISTVAGLPGRAISALGSLGSTLLQHGLDLIQGFINGIIQKAASIPGVIKDKVVGVAKSALHGFGLFGSPSRLTMKYGRWWVEGFVDGMKDKGKQVADYTRTMLDKLKEQIDKAREFARGIRDAFRQTGDLTSFSYDEGKGSSGDMLAKLTQQAKDAEAFTRAIGSLRKAGLNSTTLDQLLAAGPDGGLADAQRILSGGAGMVGAVNGAVRRIDAAGAALGTNEARARYGVNPYGPNTAVVKGGGQKVRIEFDFGGASEDALVKAIRKAVRVRGGDVSVALRG